MTGGILQLASYGIQDEILISKPEITMFRTVYRNYTNFTIDTLQTQHNIEYNTTNNIIIPKTGELLYKVVIKLEIPKVEAQFTYNNDELIYNIITDPFYNYSNTINNDNVVMIENLISSFTNQSAFLENKSLISNLLVYIGENGLLKKLNLGINGSNMSYNELNKNHQIKIEQSLYYKNRQILQTQQIPIIQSNGINYKNLLLFNESNYNTLNENIYINNYGIYLNMIIATQGSGYDYQNTLCKLLSNVYNQIYLNKFSYMLTTSFDYHNQIVNDLIYSTMPNEYLKQDYMLNTTNYEHIDDLMPYTRVKGKITSIDNNLTYAPKYLVFVDKTNQTNMLPIYITSINKYVSETKYTQSDTYYEYTGYVADTDLFYKIILNCLGDALESYYKAYVQFDLILFNNSYYNYQQINMNFNVVKLFSFAKSNMVYTYKIVLSVPVSSTDEISKLITNLKACKYLTLIITNYDGGVPNQLIDVKNISSNTVYKIPPMAILLLDPSTPPIDSSYTPTGSSIKIWQITVTCSYSLKAYKTSNLMILSPYLPIMTENKTFFNMYSTDTDYKKQVDYCLSKNISTSDVSDVVDGYTMLVFYMLNQLYKDGALIIKNTIDKKTLNVNLDLEYNLSQKENYLNNFHLSEFVDSALKDQININLNEFLNSILQAYQLLSDDDNNVNVFTKLLKMYKVVNDNKTQINTLSPFYKSIDITSFITFIYTSNVSNTNVINFNDFELTAINNAYDEIYKVRLYAYRQTNETLLTQQTFFNDEQINFIKPGNEIYCYKNTTYNEKLYIVEYYYKIISVIDRTNTYINAYVIPTRKVKDYSLGTYLDDIQNLQFLNQLSNLPNIIDQQYTFTGINNETIIYSCYYDLDYFPETGVNRQNGASTNTNATNPDKILNGKYYSKTYYFSKKTNYALEFLWQIQQFKQTTSIYNIYDIISSPNYIQGKFTYDSISISLAEINVNNLQLFDIYILMLYSSYDNIISQNTNLSNIISLIVQDYSYLISSFFKDPYLYLFQYGNYYSADTSYESLSTDNSNNNYESFDTTDYNFFNIISNSFILSSECITNTSYSLIDRVNKNLLDIFTNLLICDQLILSKIVLPILITNQEEYITTNNFFSFFNTNNSQTNVIKIITNMKNIDSLVKLNDPLPYNPYNVLKSLNVTNIYNNILISTSSVINIINTTLTPGQMVKENYVNIASLVGTILSYGNYIKYIDFFNLINNMIKNYYDIYFKRTSVLEPTINSEFFPNSSVNDFIDVFNNSITDFSSQLDVLKILTTTFTSGHMITSSMETKINTEVTKVATATSVKTLPGDPPGGIQLNAYDTDPDIYVRSNAISPYNGYLLINNILLNFKPSCSSIFGEIGGIKNGNKEIIGAITLSDSITSPKIGSIYNGLFNGTIDNVLVSNFVAIVTVMNIGTYNNAQLKVEINGTESNYLLTFSLNNNTNNNTIIVTPTHNLEGNISLSNQITNPLLNQLYTGLFSGKIDGNTVSNIYVNIQVVNVVQQLNFSITITITYNSVIYSLNTTLNIDNVINNISIIKNITNNITLLPINFNSQYVTVNHSVLQNYSFDALYDLISCEQIIKKLYGSNFTTLLNNGSYGNGQGKNFIKAINNISTIYLISITAIKSGLTTISKLTPITTNTYDQIMSKIKIFDFDYIAENKLSANTIKLVYVSDEVINYDKILITNTINTIPNLISTSVSDNMKIYTNYNFINNITNSLIMIYDSSLAYQMIDLYNKSSSVFIITNIFTQQTMTSIINLYNTYSINAIKDLIEKLSSIIDVYFTFIDILAKTPLMIDNPSVLNRIKNLFSTSATYQNTYITFTITIINQLITYSNQNNLVGVNKIIIQILKVFTSASTNPSNIVLNNKLNYNYNITFKFMDFNDKFFYLYNYPISLMIESNLILFKPSYYTNDMTSGYYSIYIEDTDSTFNLTNPFTGPTLKQNFDLGVNEETDKNYYSTSLNISTTLYNIYSLFNYFSKIVGDTINTNPVQNIPFTNPNNIKNPSVYYNKYINDNTNYNIIAMLLSYVSRYSSNIIIGNFVPQIIIDKINTNPIAKIIFTNIDIYFVLLTYISSVYNISDLFNESYSKIDNQISLLKKDSYYDPLYQVVQLPNISNYTTDTYLSCISNDELLLHLKGVITYNIENSIFSTFSIFINNQRKAYETFFTNAFNTNVGRETDIYTNIHLNFNAQNVSEELKRTNFINKRNFDDRNYTKVNSDNFKVNSSIMQITTNTNLYTLFFQLAQYLRLNLTTYKYAYNDLKFISQKINAQYYSNINLYYKWLTSLTDITSKVLNIANSYYDNYVKNDITTFNNLINTIANMDTLNTGIFCQTLRSSILSLNTNQIVDLHNFNKYYKININNQTNLKLLLSDIQNINNKLYTETNAGSNFMLLDLVNANSIIINNYIGLFYTSQLSNINDENSMTLIMQNTMVSDKINDAVNCLIGLNIVEKINVIRLYHDLPKINALVIYLNSIGQYELTDLYKYNITSTLYGISYTTNYYVYDIVMNSTEYNLIFGSILNYDFTQGSIGIIIFNKTTHLKYDIKLIYGKTKLDTSTSSQYTFTLYRKTDLPAEYKYIFDSSSPYLKEINVKNEINTPFELLFEQISFCGDNSNFVNKLFIGMSNSIYNNDIMNIYNNYDTNESRRIINIMDYYFDKLKLKLNLYGNFCYNYFNTYLGIIFNSNSGLPNSYRFNSVSGISLVKNLRTLGNPIKLFNSIFCMSFMQPKLFLTYESNYSANFIIALYVEFSYETGFILYVPKMVKKMYEYNSTKTIDILKYINTLNATIYNVILQYIQQTYQININSSTVSGAYKIDIKLNNLNLLQGIKYEMYYQVTILRAIYETNSGATNIDGTTFNYKVYSAYFVIELYKYNELLEIPVNPTLVLMTRLWDVSPVGRTIYGVILGYIKTINLTIGLAIEAYVKSSTIEPVSLPTGLTIESIVIGNTDFYSNILNSDEQYIVFSPRSDYTFDKANINNNTIKFNGVLLNEQHKLVKITYNDSTPYLYEITNVTNYTNKIIINYPYDLFFVKTISEMVSIYTTRTTNNITFNNYSGSFIISGNTYFKKYVDYDNDFLINRFQIDGIEYKLYDIQFNPISSTNLKNIPTLYTIENLTEIKFPSTLSPSQFNYIPINKYYQQSNSIEVHLNNSNQLYISSNYYIFSDQYILRPKIVAIGDNYSIVTCNKIINNVSNINNIKLGTNNILLSVIENSSNTFTDPKNIKIYNSDYSLYDIMEYFNTDTLIKNIKNTSNIKTLLLNQISSFNSDFYRNLGKTYSVNTIFTSLYQTLMSTISNDKSTLNINQFSTIYTLDLTNTNNYKIKYYNISDEVNKNLSITDIIKYQVIESLEILKNIETSYIYSKNNLYTDIIDFINKSDIPSFSYISYLSDFIFDSIDFKIDGISVDELKDKYLFLYHNFINNKTKQIGYNKLNNNNAKLLLNSQTKEALTLYIEVPLYFSQIPGVSFPLISTLYSNLELVLKIKSLEQLVVKNKFIKLKYKNKINMTTIYSVIYLDDFERELFSTKRHEYLIERKIYCTPILVNQNKLIQNKFHIPFTFPIKDYYYYIQLESMVKAGQYYNFTKSFLLPELYMTNREKLIYLQQQVDLKYYDDDIYNIYLILINHMINKIIKCNFKMFQNDSNAISLFPLIDLTSLQYLYNNLIKEDETFIEILFTNYYETKLKQTTISSAKLYLNGVERSNEDYDFTNKIIPYQYYHNMMSGLQSFTFSLHPNEYQPSGYSNFYLFKPEWQATIDKSMESLPPDEIIMTHIIARSYNIMRHMGGIAGMAW